MLTERMKSILDNGKSVSLTSDNYLWLVNYNGKYYMVDARRTELEELKDIEAVALAYKSMRWEECKKAFNFSQNDIDEVERSWGGRW